MLEDLALRPEWVPHTQRWALFDWLKITYKQLYQEFCTTFCILLGNFRIKTIISPWKSLQQEKRKWLLFCPGIQDPKTVFEYEIRQNLLLWIFLQTAWKNLLTWIWLVNIIILQRRKKKFHMTLFCSWIIGQKSYHLRFSGHRLFHGQIIVGILKLPSKTAKLPSKVRTAVHPGSTDKWQKE